MGEKISESDTTIKSNLERESRGKSQNHWARLPSIRVFAKIRLDSLAKEVKAQHGPCASNLYYYDFSFIWQSWISHCYLELSVLSEGDREVQKYERPHANEKSGGPEENSQPFLARSQRPVRKVFFLNSPRRTSATCGFTDLTVKGKRKWLTFRVHFSEKNH